MKCIALYQNCVLGRDGDIVRVSNEDAAYMVGEGEACYVDKSIWKQDVIHWQKTQDEDEKDRAEQLAYQIADFEAAYGVKFSV